MNATDGSPTTPNCTSSDDAHGGGRSTIGACAPSVVFGDAEQIVAEAYLTVVLAASVLCNIAVVWAINTTLKKRPLFRPNLFIIGHVAVTDLATAVICLPLVQAATAVGRWPFSASACAASAALNTLLITASVLCILAVSVERYFSIVRPHQYKLLVTKRRCVIAVVGIWSVSAALAIVQVVVLDNWAFYPGRAMCFMDWQT
ncbi:PREDICTED: beta-3 adrenergic receptor-like [Priapulus caudatus]|uniref:Beta-3 adrenergic receptor-like n=1 Tax=Priapulus caudatus TaxID=37621 RepID=A0ABM1EXN4_PRICU|nr:PREDICTED: beta-3 adrenergic receptor-like [Priapulus caudatus]